MGISEVLILLTNSPDSEVRRMSRAALRNLKGKRSAPNSYIPINEVWEKPEGGMRDDLTAS